MIPGLQHVVFGYGSGYEIWCPRLHNSVCGYARGYTQNTRLLPPKREKCPFLNVVNRPKRGTLEAGPKNGVSSNKGIYGSWTL